MSPPEGAGFAGWLGEELMWQDMTRLELAARGGVDPFRVLAWLEGRAVPAPEEAARLAQLFEVPVGIVLRLAGWEPEEPGSV